MDNSDPEEERRTSEEEEGEPAEEWPPSAEEEPAEEEPPAAKAPTMGEQLLGVKKGRGRMMYDAANYIYKSTKHDVARNVVRYKCLVADGGEFGTVCEVRLTTTHIGDIVVRVKGVHNHPAQKDMVEVRRLEVEERKNVTTNAYHLAGREMSVNMSKKVTSPQQLKLVPPVRNLTKKVHYDRMKANKFPAEPVSLLQIPMLYPDSMRITHMGKDGRDNEDFLLFNEEVWYTHKNKQKSAGVAWVWASDTGMRAALQYHKWTVDGTFKAAPKLFKQVGWRVGSPVRPDCY